MKAQKDTKIIAVTGKAQSGKGVVVSLLQHHLRLKGLSVAVFNAAMPIYEKTLEIAYKEGVSEWPYLDLLYNKHKCRSLMQKIGDTFNEGWKDGNNPVLSATLDMITRLGFCLDHDVVIIDSWRCVDPYTQLAKWCQEFGGVVDNPLLIQVQGDRNPLNSKQAAHETEGDVIDWPHDDVDYLNNFSDMDYYGLSKQTELLVDRHFRFGIGGAKCR